MEFQLKRRIKPIYYFLPEPGKASLGQRLRYLRKRLGLRIEDLSRKSRVNHNAISRIERDKTRAQPWVLGRVLQILSPGFKNAFPETGGDAYDFLIQPISFGAWLKNQRMRQALRLNELAAALRVSSYSVIRYESDQSRPAPAVLKRVRQLLGPYPLQLLH